MRGQSQDLTAQDASVLALPLRQGGLGIHSAFDTAEHARAASIQASDSTLDAFLSTDRMKDAVIKTQRDRCREMLDLQHKQLAASLHAPRIASIRRQPQQAFKTVALCHTLQNVFKIV